ncbi:hypothetical protein KJ632_02455 [Patescibacteria group bacterium]|nr:hypothetical protein [Patescibacteria group bacterium]
MRNYHWSKSVSSDKNGGNAVARVVNFGIKGGDRIDVDFGEFHGDTKEEAIEKADESVQKWILGNDK